MTVARLRIPKAVIVFGIVSLFTDAAISSLVRPLTGIVTSAWQLILIRMFDRIGKGIRTAPRDALIASISKT